MRGARLAMVIFGALLAAVGLLAFTGGSAIVVLHATQADSSGFFTTSPKPLRTDASAITSSHVDLGSDPSDRGWVPSGLATVRIAAQRTDGGDVFVGIARAVDVGRYFEGVDRDVIRDIDNHPFHVTYRRVPGDRTPDAPAAQSFWRAKADGAGRQAVRWRIERGDWVVVIMNADGARPVSVRASAGARLAWLFPLGLVLLIAGAIGATVGIILLVAGIRRRPTITPPPGAPMWPPPEPAAATE